MERFKIVFISGVREIFGGVECKPHPEDSNVAEAVNTCSAKSSNPGKHLHVCPRRPVEGWYCTALYEGMYWHREGCQIEEKVQIALSHAQHDTM